ncbi:MAG: DUF4424 domain-containing protein [Methyloligellaceae bacterium]
MTQKLTRLGIRLAMIPWLAFAAAGPLAANDSTAILKAGTLQLTYSPDIRLEREDLFLSTREVRVAYRFRNSSERDITTLVAFPLPVITVGDDVEYGINAKDPVNFIDFQVRVNGRRLQPSLQLRATRFGVDQTGLLKDHGIPILPFAPDFYQRLERLKGNARLELERAGLVDWSTSFGAGNKPLPTPHWRAHATYYWEQTFPAGKVTEVAHSYVPVPGVSFYGAYVVEDAALRKEYCIDNGFARAARRLMSRYPNGQMHELHYVLTTASNWQGTIGEFNLTVDKGKAGNLVSLCFDGIRKSGPTTFVARVKDFIPERDLKIMILEPARQ